MELDFSNEYKRLLKEVENRIKEYIPKSEPKVLYEPFDYLMNQGGKRIRPILTMISAGVFNEKPEEAIDVALAVEIMHNFTLAHDDIMDESPLRRNKPTVHEKWDDATAILTGDVMVGYSYKLLPNSIQNSNSDNLYATLTNGLIEVCEGQAYDMQFNERDDVSEDEYFLMITKKTARLLETAVKMGAYFAEASEEHIKSLEKYSTAIGLAFQLQDDLLDLTADEAELGKTIGQDLHEGKKTFMVIRTIKKAESKEDIDFLNKFINNSGIEYSEVPRMKEMMIRLGILDEVNEKIDIYFKTAEEVLSNLPNNQYRDMLYWIITKLNKRKA